MLKQIRQWQRALAVTLILMCVGIGLGHDIEAALDAGHGEHCSICLFGSSSAALPGTALTFDVATLGDAFTTPAPQLEYHRYSWPGYITRAPPLV